MAAVRYFTADALDLQEVFVQGLSAVSCSLLLDRDKDFITKRYAQTKAELF